MYKSGLLPAVFDDQPVVFKTASEESDDTLAHCQRSVQISILAQRLASDFNSRLEKRYHISFVPSLILELLPGAICIAVRHRKHPLRAMAKEGVYWLVEPQISGKFMKFTNNDGNIIDIEECKSQKSKGNRILATALAHYSWMAFEQKAMILDLQGAGGQFTDAEIVAVKDSDSLFSVGNMGPGSIATFFEQHECNEVCSRLGIIDQRPSHKKINSDCDIVDTTIPDGATSMISNHQAALHDDAKASVLCAITPSEHRPQKSILKSSRRTSHALDDDSYHHRSKRRCL